MKTLKKLLYIIMAVAVLAVPVFGVQAAENDIPVTEQSGVSPTSSPVPIRELVTKGNKIYISIDCLCNSYMSFCISFHSCKSIFGTDRKSTRLNSSHCLLSRMPSSA